jgi:glycosyltransferase involved in cell wall biosynthesis
MKLYLIGKKDYFYEELQKEHKNDSGIVFKHDVTDEELATLYTNAVAFISASVMEGFGLPPLEAMANGCVPLLSDIPSFHEVCEDGARYFNQNDHEKIAEAMLEWMKVSEKDKKHLLEQGKKRVTQFSWKKMAQETIAIYEGSNRLRSNQ